MYFFRNPCEKPLVLTQKAYMIVAFSPPTDLLSESKMMALSTTHLFCGVEARVAASCPGSNFI
jgi:hypothetical protein